MKEGVFPRRVRDEWKSADRELKEALIRRKAGKRKRKRCDEKDKEEHREGVVRRVCCAKNAG